jgi:hypothetical protein
VRLGPVGVSLSINHHSSIIIINQLLPSSATPSNAHKTGSDQDFDRLRPHLNTNDIWWKAEVVGLFGCEN